MSISIKQLSKPKAKAKAPKPDVEPGCPYPEVSIEGTEVVVRFSLEHFYRSGSGKMLLCASTHGFTWTPPLEVLGGRSLGISLNAGVRAEGL